MTSRKHTDSATAADRLRWRKYRARLDRRAGAGDIDPGLIASYLDGALRPAEREAVEAWLAATPEAAETLVSAREVLRDQTPVAVPDAVLAAGRAALASETAPAPVPARETRSAISGVFRWFEWSVAAAMLMLVCVAGWNAGQDSGVPGAAGGEIEVAVVEPAFLGDGPEDGLFDPTTATFLDDEEFS